MRWSLTALLVAAMASAASLSACQGCSAQVPPTKSAEPAPAAPTLRLYLLSAAAGALEPCGCSKDQLGGVHRLAAFIEAEEKSAPDALVLAAGPMFFSNAQLEADKRAQEEWKADAMAEAASKIGLAAWAPGANDWAAGAGALSRVRTASGAKLLAANLDGVEGSERSIVREVDGVRVGVIGVADPTKGLGEAPAGVAVRDPAATLRAEIDELKADGVKVFVGLAALPRGEALRLAENVPELHVLVVGKPLQRGDINDALQPAVLVGSTVVVETSNNLQTVGVVDLFLREADPTSAEVRFADAGGVAKAEELVSLTDRIRELEHRINGWEKLTSVNAKDVAARKDDLARLMAEKSKLEATDAPPSGSFFRYRAVEVRDALGAQAEVRATLAGYYKKVNEHNKEAFKDRKPPPAEPGKAGFVGIEECTICHEEEREVWDKSGHAKAYATLVKDHKEYNLDCVGCHVTGYDRPGGSTVTHVEGLKDVQCETCHGPGSLHAKDPEKEGLIILRPDPKSCVSECHHPPHVEGFDPVAKMELILGPGHGR